MSVDAPQRFRFHHASNGPPRCFGWPVVFLPTGTEAAEFDGWAIDELDVPASVLMENAGRSAAIVLDRLWPRGRVLVAVGSGNNGGDGVVLARTLAARGRAIELLVVGERSHPDPLLHGWPVDSRRVPTSDDALEALLGRADLLVDALLGTGARGAPHAPYDRVIRLANSSGRPIVSLDIPSGVDATTGAVPGDAIQSDLTVAFGDPKLGTVLFPGREHAGRLVAVEIGFPPAGARRHGSGSDDALQAPRAAAPGHARLITGGWARAHRPRRSLATHKKAAGHLLVVAGSRGMAGAAVLAARGALGAGAGYVQVASSPDNRAILQTAVPEALFLDVEDSGAMAAALAACDAIAAGPGMGLGTEVAARLNDLIARAGEREGEPPGLLLDADALTILGEGHLPAFPGFASSARAILTPHPGEMARLGPSAEEIRTDPVAVCRHASDLREATVLLKGTPSVISAPGDRLVWVSALGSSDLARAGMGDTLTGAVGSFLARGCPPLEAGGLALHFTGRAAALANRGEALLPSDVSDALAAAFRDPDDEDSELALPFVTLDLDPPR